MKKLLKIGSVILALAIITIINVDIRSDSNRVLDLEFNETVEAQVYQNYWLRLVVGPGYWRCEPMWGYTCDTNNQTLIPG